MRVVHGPGTGLGAGRVGRRKVFFTGSVADRPRRRRGVRAPAEGLRARARRQGPDDRAARRQPRPRDRRRAVGRVRERRPDVLGDRARVRDARGRRALHRRRRDRRAGAAGRRPDAAGTPRSARWSRASSSSSCASWSTTPSRRARRCAAAGPIDAPGGLSGDFYAPAVLTGVTHEMRIMREEIFGPVLPIVVVDSEDEAVALANDSEFGLGASVWTSDRGKGERIARELEAGMVWINDHMFSHGACQCSWGGVKESGLGRTHSKFGLYECVNIKLRVWEASTIRDPWWHPYDETLGRALQADRSDPLRPAVDPCRGAARRRGAVVEARRAPGARRRRAGRSPPSHGASARLATLTGDARPGLRRQGMRLPAPQGDLRSVVRPGNARDAVLHRLPAARRAAAAWSSAAVRSGSRRSRGCSRAAPA